MFMPTGVGEGAFVFSMKWLKTKKRLESVNKTCKAGCSLENLVHCISSPLSFAPC